MYHYEYYHTKKMENKFKVVRGPATTHESGIIKDQTFLLRNKVVYSVFGDRKYKIKTVRSPLVMLNIFREKIEDFITEFKSNKKLTNNFMISMDLEANATVDESPNEKHVSYEFSTNNLIFNKRHSSETITDQLFSYILKLFEIKFNVTTEDAQEFINKKMKKSTLEVFNKDDRANVEGYIDTLLDINPHKVILHMIPHVDIVPKGYIPLPNILKTKQAFINPENKDNYCILYCLLAHDALDELNNQKKKRSDPKVILRAYAKKHNIELPQRMRSDKSIEKVRDEVFKHYLKDKYEYWMNKIEEYNGILLKDFDKLCKHINKNIKVYKFYKNSFHPVYFTESHKNADISLLLLCKELNENVINAHFALITNIRIAFNPDANRAHRREFCDICMRFYNVKDNNDTESREDHIKNKCLVNPTTNIVMPVNKNTVQFTKYETKIMKDFVIFFDFESRQVSEKYTNSQGKIDERIVQVPTTVAVKLHCITDPKLSLPGWFFHHNDPKILIKTLMNKFYEYYDYVQAQYVHEDIVDITDEIAEIYNYYTVRNPKTNKYSPLQKCHFCNELIIRGIEKIVKDHCHLTGKFRGFAHHKCNSKDKHQKLLDVFSFNGMKYDLKLILQHVDFNELKVTKFKKTKDIISEVAQDYKLTNAEKDWLETIILQCRHDGKDSFKYFDKEYDLTYETTDINCIQQGSGNFLRFQVRNLVFRDAIKMYNAHNSLSELIDRLYDKGKGYHKFTTTIEFISQNYPHLNPKEIEYLATSKGHYPYLYFDSFRKLTLKRIPTIEDFKNLDDELPTQEYYDEFLKAWNLLKCETLLDYTKFYNMLDTHQLADILTDYRLEFYKHYQIDPIHFITVPAASWQAMLKYSNIKLDLITDSSIYNMIKSGIRGGNTRVYYNKYEYEEGYECYAMDVNGMYSAIMLQYLPTTDIREVENVTLQEILDTPIDADEGYYVSISNFQVEPQFHNYVENYPPIMVRDSPPDSVKIKMLKLKNKNLKPSDLRDYLIHDERDLHNKKLIQTLEKQDNYPLHYHLLKSICNIKNEDGIPVVDISKIKINKVIKFKQEPFIKTFIELNTKLRQEAKKLGLSSEELFKLIMNAIFGKSMQAVEKYKNTVFCQLLEECIHHFTDPFYKIHRMINEQMVVISKDKHSTIADQPIIVGASILDKSKTIMIDYWYQIFKPVFGDRIRIHYTDTDSMYIVVKSDKGFWYELEDAGKLHHFDISTLDEWKYADLLERNKDILSKNKKAPGLLASDTPLPLYSLTCLAAKSYTYKKFRFDDLHEVYPFYTGLVPEDNQNNKGKGIDKKKLKKLTQEQYDKVLENGERETIEVKRMIDKDKKLAFYNMEKVALTNIDNKGYVQMKPNRLILPWGHVVIDQLKMREINELLVRNHIEENIISEVNAI